MKTATANRTSKTVLVEQILGNNTYSYNSGLINILRTKLSRWSRSDLDGLALIIRIKESEAADARQDILTSGINKGDA